ncbi:MAG: phosphoesterase [Calditrichaeota bacterium]|nr:MAG: phosphoesterase [Calditrichota bacterium]
MRSSSQRDTPEKRLQQLAAVLQGQSSLLIIIHNHPDPDALAGALALSHLVRECWGVEATIACGGFIGRAENRAMVRELKIPVKNISRISLNRYSRIALLDTQPGAGNNSLPPSADYHIVIDHHPPRKSLKADFILIDPRVGASSTLLVELLQTAQLPIPANLATALAYAIRSETQDLGREADQRDIQAYLAVYARASMRKLSRIAHPKLPRSYFVTLARALHQTMTFRHLICAHLREVPVPEVVAEVADLLLRHERISWALCTGRFRGELIISLRSSNPGARSWRVIRQLVGNSRNAGGHDLFAGGKLSLKGMSEEEIKRLEEKISTRFARSLGYPEAVWKPLLGANNL